MTEIEETMVTHESEVSKSNCTDANNALNTALLKNIGVEVRGRYQQTTGNCWNISQDIQHIVETRYGISIDVREFKIGDPRATHHANTISASFVFDLDQVEGRVIVDASLDQFCTENQHLEDVTVDLGPRQYLPSVGVFERGTEERQVTYYRPNQTQEGRDVLAQNQGEIPRL